MSITYRTSSNVTASDACLILGISQSSTSQGSAQLIRPQPDTLYPATSYLPAVTLLPKPDLFPKEVFTHYVHQYTVCTGRGVYSDWKFIYYTKHTISSVSHVNTVCKKISEILYINYFNLEQIKAALLPQAGHLLFIDKVREQEMAFCYEETVYYWFSNLWMGREKR